MELKVIATVKSDFPTKFGLPRQSGIIPGLKSSIVFEKEYSVAEAFRGLEDYTHIWVVWGFSSAVRESWSPTVRHSEARREHKNRRFRNALSVPSEPGGAELRKAFRYFPEGRKGHS